MDTWTSVDKTHHIAILINIYPQKTRVIARHEAISRNAGLYYIYSMHKGGAVYILSSPNRNTLYIGVTANLPNRITEHQQKLKPTGFAARYNCVVLVYYQLFEYIEDAIRE